jgi:predicted nucleotidyltransferase
MRYKDFEGDIEELVQLKLKEIEEKEQVKILHAIESGSRAWGFASPDSDYDVRFIYIRPKEAYLKLEEERDIIDWELDETLDINGWDIKKVLKHFYKSNATLYEWSNSPIVYKTTVEWNTIQSEAKKYFSVKAAMYHYYGTARNNFSQYLLEDEVKYKKYFYVLRPILACKWIMEKECPPPVLFSDLLALETDTELREEINKLLKIKAITPESGKGKQIKKLNTYIEAALMQYKVYLENYLQEGKRDWDRLNQLFLELL